MRLTLLELTQQILSSLDSDEVNSISDTVESLQVANLIRQVYDELVIELDLPSHETLVRLNASLDSSKPCVMTVPENVLNIHEIYYDTRQDGETVPMWTRIEYKPFPQFILDQNALREDTTTTMGTQLITHSGSTFEMFYRKDQAPTYWTTADDDTLIFDAYDATVDTTLQQSKSLCMASLAPAFSMQDSFTPDLPTSQFPLLFNRVKALAFVEIKQTENRKAEKSSRDQKIIHQRRERKTPDRPEVYKVARFGRK